MRVFVHGFGQTPMASWERVARALPDEARLPNVGGGGDFVTAAHGLDHGPAEYVGYSMGGRLCLQLALDRPGIVERLVLVSGSPGITGEAERAARRDADEQLARQVEREGVDAFLERWITQPLFGTLSRELSGIDDRKASYTVDMLTHQLRDLGQGSQPDNWSRLGELPMPVLVIAGALDRKYVDIARRMGEAIPNARIEIIGDAGHACHLERADEVAHVLATW